MLGLNDPEIIMQAIYRVLVVYNEHVYHTDICIL